MRIPRKRIEAQRKLIYDLHQIKYVHYRDLNKDINTTNFQICTKVDFKAIPQNPKHENIWETWGRLMHEIPHDYYFKSRTKSEYFIDDKDNIYRFSNHWGAVASCEWTREGKGQLAMSIFECGDWEIGVANLKDFEVFRRSVDRRVDKVINPEWVTQIQTILPMKEKLEALKTDPKFKSRCDKDKMFIGKNYGFFRNELNLLEKVLKNN